MKLSTLLVLLATASKLNGFVVNPSVRSATRGGGIALNAHKLVLLRHGESTWNKENRFTGWVDCPLSEQGEREASQQECY